MAYIGIISLYLAFGLTIFAIITSCMAIRDNKVPQKKLTRQASAIATFAVSLATFSLALGFLSNDFRIAYVARHSMRSLPVIYKISALWAGQSGSLLLWLLVISILAFMLQRIREYRENDLDLRLGVVINLVRLFFLILILFVTPPFELLSDVPHDGSGLNPMLQSLGMVVHPPLLFLGFSGFLVPFALVVVGLCRRDPEASWLLQMEPWVRFSWLFLTAGIVTGGHWAYTELGWGGYWAWDPVENASLFPWLTSTALLHVAQLSDHYRSKKMWTYVLIVLTYALTIFATFLTRSGVLDSVHAFAGGVLGQIFFVVLMVIVAFCVGLGWSRRHLLGADEAQPTQSLSPSELNVLVGSVLLLTLCTGVFLGTMFPVFSRVFGSREVVLDASFFNQLSVPLFLGIIFLMSISPLLQRKKLGFKDLLKGLLLPGLLSTVLGALTNNVPFALAAFGFGTHLPILISPGSKRQWGATLVHVGVLVMLVGITGSSVYVDDVMVSVKPGDHIVVGDYELTYEGLKSRYGSDRYTVGTTLKITKNGRERGEITSEKTFWQSRSQPSTKVGIFTTFKEDLYLNLAGWENPTAQLHLQRFALVGWIWVGSWIIYFGTAVNLLANVRLCVKARRVKPWTNQTS